jgi:predicted methyltransferase
MGDMNMATIEKDNEVLTLINVSPQNGEVRANPVHVVEEAIAI